MKRSGDAELWWECNDANVTRCFVSADNQFFCLLSPHAANDGGASMASINSFVGENVYMATYRKRKPREETAISSLALSPELAAEVALDNQRLQLCLRLRDIGAKVVDMKVFSNLSSFDSPSLLPFASSGRDSGVTTKDNSHENSPMPSKQEEDFISMCVLRKDSLAETKRRLFDELRRKLGGGDDSMFPLENCRLRRFNQVSKYVEFSLLYATCL